MVYLLNHFWYSMMEDRVMLSFGKNGCCCKESSDRCCLLPVVAVLLNHILVYSLSGVTEIIKYMAAIKRIAEILKIINTLSRLNLYDSISSNVFSLRITKRYFATSLERLNLLCLLFDLAIVCKYNQLCLLYLTDKKLYYICLK